MQTKHVMLIKLTDKYKNSVVDLMDKAVEYHMNISKAFNKYIQTEDPDYHKSNLQHVLDKDNMFYIAVSNNSVLGYIEYRDRQSYIAVRDFYVNPDFRGSGIGLKLLNQVKIYSKDKEIKLTCLKENKTAYKFYLNNGFKVVGEFTDDSTGISEYSMLFSPVEV